MTNISKIVITGGPCGGKSTALSKIEEHFTSLGYRIIFVNETATEMITNGVVPWVGANLDFQTTLLQIQQHKEKLYAQWASRLNNGKILIVCDRGALDNKAYMSDGEFANLMLALETNEIEMRDQYDAVFHLVTAANGAEEFYTTANNQARTESASMAVELDNKIIAAWTGHPHLRVIDNSSDFDTKIQRLIAEISAFLGEPEPLEIERKFLIKYPDIDLLERLPNCSKVDIIQTYLCSDKSDLEIRVRQRGKDGHYVFTKTTKQRVSSTKRIETEHRITQTEYLTLLMNADTTLRQIRKIRYCLSHLNQYIEIDVYPFWQDRAILEVELSEENQRILFPGFIEVLKEVTTDFAYTNHSLAENLPKEKGD